MRKNILKQLGAGLLVLLLVVALLGGTALAAGTGSLVINCPASQTLTGRTFSAYKLFDVTTASAGKYAYYDNDGWGAVMLPMVNSILTANGDANISSFTRLHQTLESWADNDENIKALAMLVNDSIVTNGNAADSYGAVAADGTSVGFTNLEEGYYIVIETTDGAGWTGDPIALTFPLFVTVVGDQQIDLKSDVPQIDKNVEDANGNYGKAASAEVGDILNYQIDATVPAAQYMYGYDNYVFTFSDTLPTGLLYRDDAVVKIGGTALDAADYVYTSPDGGKTFSVKMDLLALIAGGRAASGDQILISYSAEVTQDALNGAAGNINEAELTFPNKPGTTEVGTSKPIDDPKVYLFRLDVAKQDENSAPLAGAEFQLTGAGASTYDLALPGAGGTAASSFAFGGLKEGIVYTLTETKAPDGYMPLVEPIEFTITANYNNTTGALESLAADNANVVVGLDAELGFLYLTIVNTAGSIFPVTGGTGTTVLMVIGIVLAGIATGFLIASMKKKQAR